MDAAALGWLEAIAKVGLGVASFAALVWYLRWMAGELKDSRIDFLVALDKRDATLAAVMSAERDHSERQTARLHEAIDDLGAEMRGHAAQSNGDGRGRGGR